MVLFSIHAVMSVMSVWEYKFIMSKRNQDPIDMFNRQDVNVYVTYFKILKCGNPLSFGLHIPGAIFKVS